MPVTARATDERLARTDEMLGEFSVSISLKRFVEPTAFTRLQACIG